MIVALTISTDTEDKLSMDAEELKERFTLTQISQIFEIQSFSGSGRSDCPFCHCENGLKTKHDRYFHCYRCQASGSIFDLLIHAGIAKNFSEAVQAVSAHYNGSPAQNHP